jgi:glycosyltransferase involved in cell wall biosynthesis
MKQQPETRVLMLLENSFFPQDQRVRREAEDLVAAGYQISVICPALPGQPSSETIKGVRVLRYKAPRQGSGLLGYAWEFGYAMAATLVKSVRLFLREGFDTIHAANPPDTFVFIAALFKPFGAKFVYDHHDIAPEMYYARSGFRDGSPLIYKALLWLEKLSYRLADHVIVTNESYKSIAMERGGVPADRITIVRNGPDIRDVQSTKPIPGLAEPGKTLIGYAGLMGPQDGVDYLLRTTHHLIHDQGRTDFRLVLVGSGEAMPGLKLLARDLNLGDHVRFMGWVDYNDVGRYLSSMDICVAPEPSNPYNDGSTMVKMMEYMAVGRPVVAFDTPENRFSAREAALYVRPNDEMEFARALAELMDNPEKRREMGTAGRRRVETELAWQYSVPKLLDVYRRLAVRPDTERLPHAHTEETQVLKERRRDAA